MMISVLLYIVAKLSVKLQKFEKNFSSPLFFHPYTAKKWQKSKEEKGNSKFKIQNSKFSLSLYYWSKTSLHRACKGEDWSLYTIFIRDSNQNRQADFVE